MIFSVFNDGIDWPVESGSDLVTLTVNEPVLEKTINSQELILVAWSLFSSQKQEFLRQPSGASSSYP